MPDCGVHYLWFAFVCFLIRSHPPPPHALRGRSAIACGSRSDGPVLPPQTAMPKDALKAQIQQLMSAHESLALTGEEIGDAGAKHIALALKENTLVTDLDLEFNGITDAGAQALFKALRGNTTLTALHLPNNEITAACLPSLRALFERNQTLQYLTLSGNEIDEDEEVMEELSQLVELGGEG